MYKLIFSFVFLKYKAAQDESSDGGSIEDTIKMDVDIIHNTLEKTVEVELSENGKNLGSKNLVLGPRGLQLQYMYPSLMIQKCSESTNSSGIVSKLGCLKKS